MNVLRRGGFSRASIIPRKMEFVNRIFDDLEKKMGAGKETGELPPFRLADFGGNGLPRRRSRDLLLAMTQSYALQDGF